MNPDESPHFEFEFYEKGKCHPRPVNLAPYADKAVTVSILKKQLADVEQLSSRPQTDEFQRSLARKKSALETLIESFSDHPGTSTLVGSTSRKDKAIARKLRRKTDRFEQGRK